MHAASTVEEDLSLRCVVEVIGMDEVALLSVHGRHRGTPGRQHAAGNRHQQTTSFLMLCIDTTDSQSLWHSCNVISQLLYQPGADSHDTPIAQRFGEEP